jgi:site-specific DNA recombinase
MSIRTAVLYARVSSREQQQEGYSIDAQVKLLRSVAQEKGYKIVREFVEVESAKASGRKQFAEMVAFFKRNRTCSMLLVEKVDRLYRNQHDAITLEDLDIETFFVKEGEILSKNAKSHVKFMHDIRLAIARNYSENLREEVKKGMREKAEQGAYPGHAPFGYCHNHTTRSIEPHPENATIVRFIFEQYARGTFSLVTLRKAVHDTYGKSINRSYIHTILNNRFYLGTFEWGGETYRGTHVPLISAQLYEDVQCVMHGHNRGKYSKHDIAFRGMLTCAHDECTVTGEVKKQKYVYYRCSGYRGKCDLPRFREEEIAARMGDVLKDIYIPDEVVRAIENSLQRTQQQQQREVVHARVRLERELADVRRRMDQAYTDKLDGKIAQEFWQRKSADWRSEELRIESQIASLDQRQETDTLLNVQRILELANRAYFLYLTRKPTEQAELLKKVLLNCSIDGVSLYPTYRKPFDVIAKRVKNEEWSGRADLNCRPLAPQASALPG